MKKILFVANSASIHTKSWVNYFIKNGYDVHLATFASINKTECKNIYYLSDKKIKQHHKINFHYLLGINKLRNIIHDLKPDFINAHFSYSMGLLSWISVLLSKHKTNLSIVCHGSDILKPPLFSIVNQINKFILKRADTIFSVSEQITTKLINDFNINESMIFTGQYGINIESNNLKWEDREIDIISIRKYLPIYRIDEMLEQLDDEFFYHKNIVFILPLIDDEKYNEFSKKYQHIKFFKYLEHKELIEMLGKAKIYISATTSDGTSLSLLESFQSGNIPVVSKIDSNRAWIINGLNGYLFKNFTEFKEKLIQLLTSNSSDKYNNMINLNIELIKEEGIYNNQMKKIENFLNRF